MRPRKPAAERRNSGFPPARIDRILSPLKRGRLLALAVSGGADSVGLMLLASRWKGPVQFTVLTLDHGLRANSRREALKVVKWARSLGFDAHRLTWREAKPVRGLQSRAREARYRLFAQ